MTSEIKVKGLIIGDDTDIRSQTVSIGGFSIETPIKSIDPTVIYTDRPFPKNSGLVELTRKFSSESLKIAREDKKRETKISSDLNNKKIRGGKNNPALTILNFDSKLYPSEEEVKQLSRIAHVFSDITPIPSIPKIARNVTISNFQEFLDYIQASIDAIQIRNKKPIMGYIPLINRVVVEELVELYAKQGINAFYIDFDATQITSHDIQIDAIKTKLSEFGYGEKHFIHFINARYGTASINNIDVVSSKDIIGFCWGLDSFGGSHMSPRRSLEYYEKLKKQKNIQQNKIRLFDKDGYGYHRMLRKDKDTIRNVFPRDSIIPFDQIKFNQETTVDRVSKIINLQQQIIESERIKEHTVENSGKTLDYFESKQFLEKTLLKKMKK